MRWTTWTRLAAAAMALLLPAGASAQWGGLTDISAAVTTDRFPFFGSNPEAGGNENYYDGDLGDIDGDGLPDRLLGARYGLLFNTGGAYMVPARRQTGLLLRGDPGAAGWGEDGMALIDVDNDGDLDALSGGNGEPLSCQINNQWRWRVLWSQGGHSALNIVPTDLENDGDVDLLVAHSFCAQSNCGGPVDFDVMVNDGNGMFTEESSARGLARASTEFVVGIVSADLDDDGDFDIITERGTASGTALHVALNDGSGHFTTRILPFAIGGSGFGQNMTLGDIDDDGHLDLIMGRGGMPYAGGHARIAHVAALGDGTGNFTDMSASVFDPGAYSGDLSGENANLVDIDYDGDLDFIALHKAMMADTNPMHHLQVFLNDGSGHLVYSDTQSRLWSGRNTGLGSDVDIADLDGDGDYDVWTGFGSDNVHIFMNEHVDPSGLPADMPRNARVITADSGGVTIGWQHPPFASAVRSYRVYRSLANRLASGDRELLARVGLNRHLDRDFFGTIDRHTTTAMLGDPNVTIDPTSGEVRYTDHTAVPGVGYFYSVVHVGPEHDDSAPTAELYAQVPGPSGADSTGPQLSIIHPTTQTWDRFPRVVVTYGDESSGVDPSSLEVSFDSPLGAYAAGQNVAELAYRHDANTLILYLEPPNALPADTVVNMNVRVQDMAGNASTDTVRFFVNTLPAIRPSPMPPTASFTATPTSGMAPIDVAFDGSASADPDGLIMRWEWYFGDGTTGIGRNVTHHYEFGGTYDVTLVARDNEGAVATSRRTLTLTGMPPTDGGPPGADAGVGDAGNMSCMPSCDRRSCGDDGCGGVCGTCGAGTTCSSDFQCLCATGEVGCGGVCGIDLDNDVDNCGACGNACASGVCSSGVCEPVDGGADGCTCRAAGGGSGPRGLFGLGLIGLAVLARRRRMRS
ncbi:MAG: FG-GAP-like repeat-containing protein [Sandaracinaceae bacterium]